MKGDCGIHQLFVLLRGLKKLTKSSPETTEGRLLRVILERQTEVDCYNHILCIKLLHLNYLYSSLVQ